MLSPGRLISDPPLSARSATLSFKKTRTGYSFFFTICPENEIWGLRIFPLGLQSLIDHGARVACLGRTSDCFLQGSSRAEDFQTRRRMIFFPRIVDIPSRKFRGSSNVVYP